MSYHKDGEARRWSERLYVAQEAICACCGQRMAPTSRWGEVKNRPTLDHVKARAAGGKKGKGNLILMHRLCNTAKDSRPPTGCELIWLQAVNALLGWGGEITTSGSPTAFSVHTA